MENASKALIIAGAILLAILIIGLGMFIYQQASGAMTGANLDPTKAQAYNSVFLNYSGTISGSNARALYTEIANHNRSHTDDKSQQIILTISDTELVESTTAEPPSDSDDTNLPTNSLKAGNTYHVTFQYSKAGYITKCNIKEL